MSTLRVNTIQNSGGTGSPAISGLAAAWVNFNGIGTVAIRASNNVSSITDNAAGDYTVNFTTALVDANYAVSCNRSDSVGGRTATSHTLDGQTTTSVRVFTRVSLTNIYDTLEDVLNMYVVIFR